MQGAQQSGSTTQTNAPYSGFQPYIGTALGQAGNLLQSGGPQYYPGQQVASFNPVQQQSFGQVSKLDNNLMQGSGNPYENQMFQQEMQQVQPQLASQFAGSGRDIVGSMPLAQQQLGNMGAQFYGQQYQNDVSNAMNAGQQKLGIGNQIQGQSQAEIDASKNAFNFNQNRPYQNLGTFESFISQMMPGSGQQSSPYFTNPGANSLGMLLGGEQLYNGMKGGNKPSSGGSSGGSGGSSWGGIPFQ